LDKQDNDDAAKVHQYYSDYHDYPAEGRWVEKSNVQLGFVSDNDKKLINLLQSDADNFDPGIYDFMDSASYIRSERAAMADQIVNVEFTGGFKAKEDKKNQQLA